MTKSLTEARTANSREKGGSDLSHVFCVPGHSGHHTVYLKNSFSILSRGHKSHSQGSLMSTAAEKVWTSPGNPRMSEKAIGTETNLGEQESIKEQEAWRCAGVPCGSRGLSTGEGL